MRRDVVITFMDSETAKLSAPNEAFTFLPHGVHFEESDTEWSFIPYSNVRYIDVKELS